MKSESKYDITLSVDKHVQKFIKEKGTFKTHYLIEVIMKFYNSDMILEEKSWNLEKTYEEFEKLYLQLKKAHQSTPKIPGKSIFTLKSTDELNKRKTGFDIFLKECVLRTEIRNDLNFNNFIRLLDASDKYKKKLLFVNGVEIGVYSFTKLFHIAGTQVLYAAAFLQSKSILDKILRNSSVADENTQNYVTPSKMLAFDLEAAYLKRDISNDISFSSEISQIFSTGIDSLIIGFTDGRLMYKSSRSRLLDDNLGNMIEIKAFKSSKIRGLGIYGENLFAISDTKLKVFSTINNSLIVESKLNIKVSRSFFISNKSEFVIGTDNGEILVISVLNCNFTVKGKIKICNSNSKIISLKFDSGMATAVTKEGSICIINFHDGNDVLQIKKVFKPKVKVSIMFQFSFSLLWQYIDI